MRWPSKNSDDYFSGRVPEPATGESDDCPRMPLGMRIEQEREAARRPYLDAAPKESDIDWPRCSRDGCNGISLEPSHLCIAHAADDDRATRFEEITRGAPADFRGVRFSEHLFAELSAALPRVEERSQWHEPSFVFATFEPDASFAGDIIGGADFQDATFLSGASFSSCVFDGPASFARAKFLGTWAGFNNTIFKGDAHFMECAFATLSTMFIDALFETRPWFRSAVFHLGHVDFGGSEFPDGALFWDVEFPAANLAVGQSSWLELRGVVATESIELYGPKIQGALTLRGADVSGRLLLAQTTLEGPAVMECSCGTTVIQRVDFIGGLRGVLSGADIALEDCRFAERSSVTGRAGNGHDYPRLLSLRRTDCENLTLSELRLDACLFDEALHVDALTIDATCSFQPATKWWQSGRAVIAEEHRYRHREGRRGWYPASTQFPAWVETGDGHRPGATGSPVSMLRPDQIMVLYRALRGAREDNRDEPGAADFYYGEMDARDRVIVPRSDRENSPPVMAVSR